MALSVSSSLVPCSRTFQVSPKSFCFPCSLRLPVRSLQVPRISLVYRVKKRGFCVASSAAGKRGFCVASSAAGSSSSADEFNPYEVLGVSPLLGFDKIKGAYQKKKKEAERIGDEVTVIELEKAYDKIMMAQLTKRKMGETFGSFKVSKDIKFADKLPVVPWGPRFTKSDDKDIKINLAIAAFFTAWILIRRTAEWKPLQFVGFVFIYRIYEKLKEFAPPASPSFSEDGMEDDGRMLRMGKTLARSLALVIGCIAFSSVGYTGLLNLIEYTAGYIPRFLYNNQELLITASTAVLLHIIASYYR